MTKLDFTLFKPWKKGSAEELSGLWGLGPVELGFLLSPGSMTEALEVRFGSKVGVEVKLRGTTTISNETARFLDGEQDVRAMERGVWLIVDNKRLVYAHSLIPLESLEARLRNVLEEMDTEPIGRVLNSHNITFTKKKIEVGLVMCPQTALDLDLERETIFFARRYVLVGKKDGEESPPPSIKAAIIEIFNPRLVSTGSITL
ncbi:MAG: hypothetical protein BMS9Abin23_0833 [Thermodesulfobacteriota bacterium]|nr:MAG: hypothetical protein BMS9Abin23_0833 [Thermodesulfobacteriota bacterium]